MNGDKLTPQQLDSLAHAVRADLDDIPHDSPRRDGDSEDALDAGHVVAAAYLHVLESHVHPHGAVRTATELERLGVPIEDDAETTMWWHTWYYDPARLARIAHVAAIPTAQSPARAWLWSVAEAVADSDLSRNRPDTVADQVADAHYGEYGGFASDYEMWKAFVDLDAWRHYDDTLARVGGDDITRAADVPYRALRDIAYLTAHRLALTLDQHNDALRNLQFGMPQEVREGPATVRELRELRELRSGMPPEPKAGQLTRTDVTRYPWYYLSGPGRPVAQATDCPHGYTLVDSCPGCDHDEQG